MKVHNCDVYVEDGKYYCLECNAEIVIRGHVKGCSHKDSKIPTKQGELKKWVCNTER